MHTKGQMEMMETVVVLIVFLVLIVIGLIGYGYYMKSSIKQMEENEKVERSLLLMNYILNSAEFHCSRNNVVKVNCIDFGKVKAFEGVGNENYREIFGFSKIGVKKIYPDKEDVVYFYEEGRGENKIVRSVPVLIYDGSYKIGMLVLEIYEWRKDKLN